MVRTHICICKHTYTIIDFHIAFVGKKQQAITLKLGGVTVNCQSILRREEELAPLARCIPKDPTARKRFAIANLHCCFTLLLLQISHGDKAKSCAMGSIVVRSGRLQTASWIV